jgi:ribosomal protein S18 acetylase RimI-like enzyme
MVDYQLDWFSIRRVRLNDLPEIYKIDSTSLVSNFSIDGMLERVVKYNDISFVAVENNTNNILGYIIGTENEIYTKNYPNYLYMSRFAVKNEYRRRGVGSTLLIILENHALASGKYRGLVGDVRRSNIPSLSFFEYHGFRRSTRLSKEEGYERGETAEDRAKVVLYKKFSA